MNNFKFEWEPSEGNYTGIDQVTFQCEDLKIYTVSNKTHQSYRKSASDFHESRAQEIRQGKWDRVLVQDESRMSNPRSAEEQREYEARHQENLALNWREVGDTRLFGWRLPVDQVGQPLNV